MVSGDILTDLSQRRAVTDSIVHNEGNVVVSAHSPVATLLGYSTALRKISSGQAHFMMEIDGYTSMTEQEMHKVIAEAKNF